MNDCTRALLVLFLAGLTAACIEPPAVVQGTVASYDPAAKILVMTDELAPEAALTISVAEAEIGAEPAVGDTVRIAYRDQQGKLVATRVMNLTRQTEVGGGGH